MPSVSKAQQRLMGAAEHGADFPMAKKLRGSMSHQQLHDFASGPETGKPEHVVKGAGRDVVASNTQTFKNRGLNEHDSVAAAIGVSKGRHKNLGKFLHPRKDGKKHGS